MSNPIYIHHTPYGPGIIPKKSERKEWAKEYGTNWTPPQTLVIAGLPNRSELNNFVAAAVTDPSSFFPVNVGLGKAHPLDVFDRRAGIIASSRFGVCVNATITLWNVLSDGSICVTFKVGKNLYISARYDNKKSFPFALSCEPFKLRENLQDRL